jgi:drug/metabolite transporter (DMT)-like permease
VSAAGAANAPARETSLAGPRPYGAFTDHARSAALVAALALSFTAVFFALSDVSPSAATVYRSLYALPFLWWLARREDRIAGGRPWHARRWAMLAGVFFAIDLVLFHEAILLMGAGLASVMSNLQVVIVLVAAWLIWGERPSSRQAAGIPIALVGIVLISGVLDASAYGNDPVLGSVLGILVAISYAAYLLLIRKGRDLQHAAGPVFDATLACAATGAVAGVLTGQLDLVPSLPGHVWLFLLAISAQVAGSVLIAVALPRLPAATTSLILLVQPVLAVLLAMVLLAETPSALQLVGVGLVIGGVLLGSATGRASGGGGRRHDPAPLEA